jgi:hypothetical protein
MDFAVAIAEMYVDGFAFEAAYVVWRRVRKHKMANIDVRAHSRVSAFVNEPYHGIDAIEKAEAKRFEFQRDIDSLFVRIIAQAAAGLDAPLPLGGGRDDFALPDVFAKHEENIPGSPLLGEVDEFFAAFDVKFANGLIEVDQAYRNDWERNDRQAESSSRALDGSDFFLRNADGFGKDVDGVKTNAFDVFEACDSVHTDLLEGAVDETEFHAVFVAQFDGMNRLSFARSGGMLRFDEFVAADRRAYY